MQSLLLALAAATLVRLPILAVTASAPPRIVDEQHYVQLADNLLDGHGFAMRPGRPTSLRPPLYPGFLAALWRVTGRSFAAARLAQLALALLTVVVVYLLGREVFDSATGALAAWGVALYPSLVFTNFLFLTETLFTLLLVAAVLACVVVVRNPRSAIALGTGILLGLAALTRSVLWPYPAVVVPALLLFIRPRARGVLMGLLLMVGYGLVVAPWAVRNTRLERVPVVVDTMGGLNLRMGNYEHTPEDRMWAAVALQGESNWAYVLRREHPDVARWTNGEKERWARREALSYMRAHPLVTLRRAVIKFGDFWGLEREFAGGVLEGLYRMPRPVAIGVSALLPLAYVVTLGTALFGIFLASSREPRTAAWCLMPVVFICAVHTIVFGHSRYHLPLIPLLLVFSAAAVRQKVWRELRVPRRALAPLASAAVFVALWARQVFLVDVDRVRQLLQLLR